MESTVKCLLGSDVSSNYIRSGKSPWIPRSLIFTCECWLLYELAISHCIEDIWPLIWLSSCPWLHWISLKLTCTRLGCSGISHAGSGIIEWDIWLKCVCLPHPLVVTLIIFIMISYHVAILIAHLLSCLCHIQIFYFESIYYISIFFLQVILCTTKFID